MADGALLTSALITGLVGSTHCAGMCGGIVTSLAWRPAPAANVIRIHDASVANGMSRQLAFNTGRLATYALLGALAGGISATGIAIGGFDVLREMLLVIAQLMVVLLGVHLTGILQPLRALENVGAKLWRHIQPFAARMLPSVTPGHALLLGAAWGWLPCGMIYSMLVTAMATGTPEDGAMIMLAFGAGTLPMLLLLGGAAERSAAIIRSPRVRLIAGCVVIALGIIGLARISGHQHWAQLIALCRGAVVTKAFP